MCLGLSDEPKLPRKSTGSFKEEAIEYANLEYAWKPDMNGNIRM